VLFDVLLKPLCGPAWAWTRDLQIMSLATQTIYELIYQLVNELCANKRSTIGQRSIVSQSYKNILNNTVLN